MNLMAVLEGLLFIVGDEGLSIDKIQELLQTSEEETKQILKDLVVEYSHHLKRLLLSHIINQLQEVKLIKQEVLQVAILCVDFF